MPMADENISERASDRPVLVMGAAGLDMIGRLYDEPLEGTANPAAIRVSFGGVGRNVAENLARLGQPVRLITAVGQDPHGRELLAQLAACDVNVDACLVKPGASTAAYLAIFHEDGTRHLVLEDMSALESLTAAYVQEHQDCIDNAAMIFLDANLSEETLVAIFSLAEAAHVPVCVDATSRRLVTRLDPYLEKIYMICANSAEASALCEDVLTVSDETTGLQAARYLVDRGVELAVVTLGEFGVAYATSETSGHVPAIRTPVVDPTGAGDALTATVLFGLLNDIPIDESVRLGVTAASLILRHRGTVLPGLTLEKLYDELIA
jgi:pseudouridine kinase